MTLLFEVSTKNASFRSYSTFVYPHHVYIPNINMCAYITSAHGHELSGCILADAFNLMLVWGTYDYSYSYLVSYKYVKVTSDNACV